MVLVRFPFFVHPCQNYNKIVQFDKINALRDLGSNKTMNKDFRRLKFFYFQGFPATEFVRFYGPTRETKDLFHGQKNFLEGQPREIMSGQGGPIFPAQVAN